MTKKQQAQAERERVKTELLQMLEQSNRIIYTVTLSSGYNTNGNRMSRARFWTLYPNTAPGDATKSHLSYHIATLLHGRFTNATATVDGYTHNAIADLSHMLYGNQTAITPIELNP